MISASNLIINAVPWSWKKRVRATLLGPRLATSRWRTLPDFAIIGGQRCGTTSLYRYLMEHPCCIYAFEKEVHFFDNNYGKGMDWYLANFPTKAYMGLLARCARKPVITGEASPLYMFHPLAPQRMAEDTPQIKIIALLRNPVDRAFSHYQHESRLGHETLDFEQALEAESERLKGERDRMLEDPSYYSFDYAHFSYKSRGIYVDQLAYWRQFFPREQLLILSSEDLYAEPARVMMEVQDFLGLPVKTVRNYKAYNKGSYHEDLEPQLRKHLQEIFAPHNQRLYGFLERDFGWDVEDQFGIDTSVR